MFVRLLVTVGVSLLVVAAPARADPVDQLCARAAEKINVIADGVSTLCLTVKGDDPGTRSVMLMTSARVFDNARLKQGWLMLGCATIGAELNAGAKVRLDKVTFSDLAAAKGGYGYAVPAALCMQLQRDTKADKLTLTEFYAAMNSKLTRIGNSAQ